LKIANIVLCVFAFVTEVGGAAGQQTVLELDPVQTRVDFSLGSVLHTVHGTFHLKRGAIRFDPSTGNASGELVVDAASGNSGNGTRDSRMNKNILESQRYPEIIFRPDRFEGKIPARGPFDVQLHGLFSIHGAEHEMTLPVKGEIAPEHVSADTRFLVPYIQWGMKNPSTLFLRVNDTVDIEIHAVGR
jgi:polyisoprenoid-binding protein YceI